jgi:hypothetical protein
VEEKRLMTEPKIRRVIGRSSEPHEEKQVLQVVGVVHVPGGMADLYVNLPPAQSLTAVELRKEIAKIKRMVELEHQKVQTGVRDLRTEEVKTAERLLARANELHERRNILEHFLEEIGE